mmetsp:Transcript_953/g.2426  ORF Transcript_953/g.2426 Transcript_953/m.2426 type:complete len:238 (-) Transcript_953:931-1644(-)
MSRLTRPAVTPPRKASTAGELVVAAGAAITDGDAEAAIIGGAIIAPAPGAGIAPAAGPPKEGKPPPICICGEPIGLGDIGDIEGAMGAGIAPYPPPIGCCCICIGAPPKMGGCAAAPPKKGAGAAAGLGFQGIEATGAGAGVAVAWKSPKSSPKSATGAAGAGAAAGAAEKSPKSASKPPAEGGGAKVGAAAGTGESSMRSSRLSGGGGAGLAAGFSMESSSSDRPPLRPLEESNAV